MGIAPAYPSGRARPLPCPGIFHQTRPDWIRFDVTQRLGKVSLIERTREEAILPQVAGLALADMKPAGIVVVRSPEAFRQRIVPFRDGYQVNMVGHEAVAEDPQPGTLCMIAEQPEIDLSIGIAKKHVLPLIATLRNVMRPARQHDARSSSHLGS
jgi:hypothetical protein